MATANQIKYRLGQAKKKLVKILKEAAATKKKIKTLEGQFKRAKAAQKPRKKARPKAKAKARPKAKSRAKARPRPKAKRKAKKRPARKKR